jgi:hypothetical protein
MESSGVSVWSFVFIYKGSCLVIVLSRKHPLFRLCFQLTIIVENDHFDYNFFFSIVDHKSWKVQVKNEIVIKSDDHVSTPQQ